MQDLRMNIHFFDFVDKYYSELKELNVLTTSKWTKENKTIVILSSTKKKYFNKCRKKLDKSLSF